jgi:hypothetical protein
MCAERPIALSTFFIVSNTFMASTWLSSVTRNNRSGSIWVIKLAAISTTTCPVLASRAARELTYNWQDISSLHGNMYNFRTWQAIYSPAHALNTAAHTCPSENWRISLYQSVVTHHSRKVEKLPIFRPWEPALAEVEISLVYIKPTCLN